MSTTTDSTSRDPETAALADWRRHTPGEWLTAVVEPQRVRAALEEQVPAFAAGDQRLEHCQIKRLRLRDESGCWVGAYLLTVTNNATGTTQTVPVLGKLYPPSQPLPDTPPNGAGFGTPSWRCILPALRLELATQPEEGDLPALPQLTNATAARALLEESIRTGSLSYPHLRLQGCRPQIMRYKPGSRCTILYHLDYGPDDSDDGAATQGPPLVVAKTYRGNKGENAYHAMRALWASPLGRSQTVALAEPLAFLPDLNILIQGPIRQQQTLKELVRQVIHGDGPMYRARLDDYLRKTAQGLAELHQCGVQYGEVVTWEDELADVLEQRARLSVPLPSFADLAETLLARLRTLAAQNPPDPIQPAHRSFRPAQVLLHEGAIGFIDFDGFCQAEPAMDLALFMTTIKNIALNRSNKYADDDEEGDEEGEQLDEAVRLARMQESERLCTLFLREYEKHAPVSRTRIMLWETLDLLALIFGSWLKIKFARLDNCMFMLERHLAGQRELVS